MPLRSANKGPDRLQRGPKPAQRPPDLHPDPGLAHRRKVSQPQMPSHSLDFVPLSISPFHPFPVAL
ncbi:hypothetical protein RRF57_012167 [Xylaria bambusicola]|uniref:Uncharacterized protein n=1 Tax=Xylaria bambusicola TaxID=326684 RepID=A0AAN7Z4B0_9PEZI